jgi:hypothetical protein
VAAKSQHIWNAGLYIYIYIYIYTRNPGPGQVHWKIIFIKYLFLILICSFDIKTLPSFLKSQFINVYPY